MLGGILKTTNKLASPPGLANFCRFGSSPKGILEHHGNAYIVITLELD
jgi:hypothetical protein